MSLVETYHRQHLERQLRFMQAALTHQMRKAPRVVVVVRPPDPPPPPVVEAEPFPFVDDPAVPVRMDAIRKVVAQHFGVTKTELMSSRRSARIVVPRQVAFYLGRRLTTLSFPMIGRHMGRKDHTTVLHGCRNIARKMQSDERLRASIEMLTEHLGGEPE